MDEAKEALERIFGIAAFFPGQQDVLEAVFAGENPCGHADRIRQIALLPVARGRPKGPHHRRLAADCLDA
jgi:hypothetical protein